MDILYGVCGVGMGHVSRSYPIVKELSKKNNVIIIGHNNSADFFKEKGFEVIKYKYVDLNVSGNSLSSRKVFLNTAQDLPRVMQSLLGSVGKLRGKKFDYIISDFEWASLAFSRYKGIKNLAISNYHLVDCFDFQKPFYYYVREVPIISYFKTNADKIIIPWDSKLVKRKEKYVFSGIEKVVNGKVIDGEKYFGYFPGGVPAFYKGEVPKKIWERKKFLEKLAKSKAYFSHGGFSSLVEALNFKKALGMIPTKGFYERIQNAEMVEWLGFGKKIEDKKDYLGFEENLKAYRTNIRKKVKVKKNALLKCVKKELSR